MLLLLGVGSAARAEPGPPAEEVRVKVRAVFADPRYQRELPPHSAPEPSSSSRLPGGGAAGQVLVPAVGAVAPLAMLVIYTLVVVAIVLVVVWIVSEVTRRRRGPKAAPPAQGDAEGAERGRPEREALPGDATRLAAEGRFGEAIHVLLLVAIRQLAERSRVPVQASRTSRELARLLPLAGDGRKAFEELVRAVELTLFGGVPAGAEDWERSLGHFRRLTGRPA